MYDVRFFDHDKVLRGVSAFESIADGFTKCRVSVAANDTVLLVAIGFVRNHDPIISEAINVVAPGESFDRKGGKFIRKSSVPNELGIFGNSQELGDIPLDLMDAVRAELERQYVEHLSQHG